MNKRVIEIMNGIDAYFAELRDILTPLEASPERVVLCSPVTGEVSVTANVFGGEWWVATKFAERYGANGHIHPGVDLNLSSYRDSGKPVFAVADGEIVFSGQVKSWEKSVVVLKVTLEDGKPLWVRYAHLADIVPLGMVKRGQKLGIIADYGSDGPKQDHLHLDFSKVVDLGEFPGDWPGTDEARVRRSYSDPEQLLKERSK